jgi:hypothetical protein
VKLSLDFLSQKGILVTSPCQNDVVLNLSSYLMIMTNRVVKLQLVNSLGAILLYFEH